MNGINDIQTQLTILENNYNDAVAANNRLKQNKLLFNGSEQHVLTVIGNEISKLTAKNIPVTNASNIKKIGDLKTIIDDYLTKFNSTKAEIDLLNTEFKNLDQTRIQLTNQKKRLDDYMQLRQIQNVLALHKQDIKSQSLGGTTDKKSTLLKLWLVCEKYLTEKNKNLLESQINICINNNYINLDYLINMFDVIGNSITDLKDKVDFKTYKNDLEKKEEITEIKVGDIIDYFQRNNNSLVARLVQFRNSKGLTNDSLVKIDDFITLINNDISFGRVTFPDLYSKQNELNTKIAENQRQINSKKAEINSKLDSIGVPANAFVSNRIAYLPTRKLQIEAMQKEINSLNNSRKNDENTVEKSKNALDKLNASSKDFVQMLINQRKSRISDLEKEISVPARFLSSRGINLNGLSVAEVNRLSAQEYIRSLNEIYTETLKSYVKFQFQIPLYLNKFDYSRNHTVKEQQEIDKLSDFTVDLDNFLSKLDSRLNTNYTNLSSRQARSISRNIAKVQKIDADLARYNSVKNNIKSSSYTGINLCQNFTIFEDKIRSLTKKRAKLILQRESKVRRIVASSIRFRHLIKDVHDVNINKSFIQRIKDNYQMLNPFSIGYIDELLINNENEVSSFHR